MRERDGRRERNESRTERVRGGRCRREERGNRREEVRRTQERLGRNLQVRKKTDE